MKLPIGLLTILIVLVAMAASPTTADQKSTMQPAAWKVKTMVEAAHAYVRVHSDDMATVQHALQTNPEFIHPDKNLYVFIHCYNFEKREAICCGHGIRSELLGKNMWHLRTPNGRLLFHEIAHMIERDGDGWIEYDWLNPYTNSLQTKVSYVKGILLKDGQKAWVGCGFWKEN